MALVVREELVVPFPAPTKALVPLAKQFRSTWLTSSLKALKGRGRYEDYLKELPAEHHAAVESSIAGTWLSTSVAVAHYEACDRLGFSAQEQYQIGREVQGYAQTAIFSVAIKAASRAGVTPWTALSQFNKMWNATWIGGGVGVYKLGPKEARAEIAGWPCSGTPYIRHAMRGVMAAMVETVCQKAYVSEVGRMCSATTLAYRLAWV